MDATVYMQMTWHQLVTLSSCRLLKLSAIWILNGVLVILTNLLVLTAEFLQLLVELPVVRN